MHQPQYEYKLEDLAWIVNFMDEVRDYFFVRPQDNLLILRPNKVMHLNETGTTMLRMLMDGSTPEEVRDHFVRNFEADGQQVLNDLAAFADDLRSMVMGNQNIYSYKTARIVPFGEGDIKFPVLSEIALTYRCNNECQFCYAFSPHRETKEMTTDEVRRIIDMIADDAHVPSLSFTGGEPTLREDLFELIAYARGKGLRVNLITNGRRCADPEFVQRLVQADLNSAQVSIEGPDAKTHDQIAGAPGSFEQTVKGIKNLKETDIYTHCNTTICRPNVDKLEALVDFIADELELSYFSMNMVIYTGTAAKLRNELQVKYEDIGEIVKRVKRRANKKGVQFVWYAPTPVCMFNPIALGLGAKSCAACDGLLSVDAEGGLLPCSSFSEPVGNLLQESFEKVWNNRASKFWRSKDYAPVGCKECDHFDYCFGACPLYWDVHGFDEIKEFWPKKSRVASKVDDARLSLRRRIRGDQRGIT
jgi:radical SAM protein with 4Fe4S-binding SPASM domain